MTLSVLVCIRPRKRRAILVNLQLLLYPLKDPDPETTIDLRDATVNAHPKKRDVFTVTLAVHKNQTFDVRLSSSISCNFEIICISF